MYRRHGTTRTVLVGVCLWVVRRAFGDAPPSLAEYCKAEDIGDDTIRRTARALLFPVVRSLRRRRPGRKKPAGPSMAQQALAAVNDLLHALLPKSIPKLLKSPATRGLVVQQALFWRRRGVQLTDLAGFLNTSPRQLSRWIVRLGEDGAGCTVPHRSRRPQRSPNQVPGEVQHALRSLGAVCRDFSTAQLTRLFNQRFRALRELYDLGPLSAKTVAKYASGKHAKTTCDRRESPRGGYDYPAPMTMAWVDTTHFSVAGLRVHIVVAMEAFSRLTLAGEAVVQENSEVAASVLSAALARAPGLRAVVRDRGKPYLNTRVDGLLADSGCLPIDAHPHFPIDKAALERFFGPAKHWLRAALAQLEHEWRCRQPSTQEVLSAVRSALQIYLRAYNLIPQPYLEAKCPFDRLGEALKDAGALDPQLARFQQLARERENKAAVLAEVRDGLQIDLEADQMLRDFATIDKRSIQSAFDICFHKLVEQRDQSIRWPYRYLLVVARRKNRELRESRAHAHRTAVDDAARRGKLQAHDDRRRREQNELACHPEHRALAELEIWLGFQVHPGFRNRGLGESKLRQALGALRHKLGTAFDACLLQLKDCIPRIVENLSPRHPIDFGVLTDAFSKLAHELPDAGGGASAIDSRPPPGNINANLVRQAFAAIPVPHDGMTNVRP